MSKKAHQVVAAIDIGSSFLRLMIAEVNSHGEIKLLEDANKPTDLGRDTFANGTINGATIHETCADLQKFSTLLKDYGCKTYRAVATSGMREAENREYVLDQILQRTGINIELINNSQERFYIYKGLRLYIPEHQRKQDEGILIVNIGSGGLEISVINSGHLQYTEYLKVGSLRLREVLDDLERTTLDFPSIMEEFLLSKTYLLEPKIEKLRLSHVIALGGMTGTIVRLCTGGKGQDRFYAPRAAVGKLYQQVRTMTTEQIIKAYNLMHNEADILLPCMIIYRRFLNITQAEGMYTPQVSLRHGIITDIADEIYHTRRGQDFQQDMISSAWHISRTYQVDAAHSERVAQLALTIFDQTSRIHHMAVRDRLLLYIAAILHDVGKFVNYNLHDTHSYNIIRAQEIIGFSNSDIKVVANVARYHSEDIPLLGHANFRILDKQDRIKVSKLAAILRLADALDLSHRGKVDNLELEIGEREVGFKVEASGEILLEEWTFNQRATLFEEVMGYQPVLKRKGKKA